MLLARLFVLYNLPTLEFLDFTAISDKERQEAAVRGAFLHVVRPADEILERQLAVLTRIVLCVILLLLIDSYSVTKL